jgi:hypothetical protein
MVLVSESKKQTTPPATKEKKTLQKLTNQC